MENSTKTLISQLGFLLTRVVVPLWVLAGATFKLIEATPANLPSQILRTSRALGCTNECLDWLLTALISIEFLAVAVMVFIAWLARPVAIFILSAFVVVLLAELATGNFETCGCLGKIPVKPWQMLAIDGALLAGVIFTGRRAATYPMESWRLGPAVVAVIAIAAPLVSAWRIIPDRRDDVRIVNDGGSTVTPIMNGTIGDVGNNSTASTSGAFTPVRPPRTYYPPENLQGWIGKPWREIDVLTFLPRPPVGIDEGTRYIVFYSRSCDHCELMFWDDLIGPIGAQVTAVEIPGAQTWQMPDTECELMTLSTGTNWLITPPMAIKVVNGVIACAQEKDHKSCMDLQ